MTFPYRRAEGAPILGLTQTRPKTSHDYRGMSDEVFAAMRDRGELLCSCPGERTRQLDVFSCSRCGMRIHRRYDSEIQHPSQEDS